MGEPRPAKYHEQAIIVVGFLGAVVFATLVFVLQDKSQIESIVSNWFDNPAGGSFYFQLLITLMGIDSVLFVITSLIMLDVSSLKEWSGTKYEDAALLLFIIGVIVLFVIMPLLLAPFSIIGAAIVFITGEVLTWRLSGITSKGQTKKSR